MLEPKLTSRGRQGIAERAVFGTVQGDIYDIVKNIVVVLLRDRGFEVYDLGADVPAAHLADQCKGAGASVLGLSGLISSALWRTSSF